MFKTGVCSVTFRKCTVEQVVDLAVKAGLEGIEWGGDVHVPPGNVPHAEEVANITKQAGLNIVSYGSYYRVGCEDVNAAPFEDVLQTAVGLGAPSIRVWAGNRGSEDVDKAYWKHVLSDARRIASLAEGHGIRIDFEFHGGTLTDTRESAFRLMEEAGHRNLKIYWQPAVGRDVQSRIDDMRKIQRWLTHVHVFHWEVRDRLPLKEGEQEWMRYIQALGDTAADRYMLLEFVREDDPQQFLEDADTLRNLISR